MLSDRQIRGIKPAAKHQFISDGNGLYLRVHPSGKKQFVYRSRVSGSARWVTIGDFGAVTLADARRRALDFKDNAPTSVTVAEAFEAYYAKVVKRDYKRPEQVKARMALDILPALGKRYVSDITRADVANTLQKIVDRGSAVAANRTLADVKHMFDYCVDRGWIEASPAARIRQKIIGGKETARSRTLSDAELDAFFPMLRGFYPLAAAVLYLCLLTGQRIGEVLGINRSEIAGVWWTIPAARTKANREQKVYLSVQARAALRLLFLVGDAPFAEMSKHTPAQSLARAAVGYTPHDLRRTMATRLADLGVAPHVVEKMLNHKMTGVMAVYNHAEYLPEREVAWRRWGAWVAQKRRAGR
jgi:integrase